MEVISNHSSVQSQKANKKKKKKKSTKPKEILLRKKTKKDKGTEDSYCVGELLSSCRVSRDAWFSDCQQVPRNDERFMGMHM